jgi:hypothetical protein
MILSLFHRLASSSIYLPIRHPQPIHQYGFRNGFKFRATIALSVTWRFPTIDHKANRFATYSERRLDSPRASIMRKPGNSAAHL